MRQNFVPRISFHAKFEVAIPNLAGNALLRLRCRHVTVKFLATSDCVSQRGKEFARPFEDFRNRVNESLVIARLMSFDRRRDRRQDVGGPAVSREENFDARACSFCRLNKDEFIFVRKDHASMPQKRGSTAQSVARLINARQYSPNRTMHRNVGTRADDLFSETFSVRSYSEDGW